MTNLPMYIARVNITLTKNEYSGIGDSELDVVTKAHADDLTVVEAANRIVRLRNEVTL